MLGVLSMCSALPVLFIGLCEQGVGLPCIVTSEVEHC